MVKINQAKIVGFVSPFFGNEHASVKMVHNPDSIATRFQSLWGAHPKKVFGFALPRRQKSQSWRKALIYVNKNEPNTGRRRKPSEVYYTAVHEYAHVYSSRNSKLNNRCQEIFAHLVALEFLAKFYPAENKLLLTQRLKRKGNLMVREIPLQAVMINKYLPKSIRLQVLRDLIDGKIREDGKGMDEHIQKMVANVPGVAEKFMSYLNEWKKIPF